MLSKYESFAIPMEKTKIKIYFTNLLSEDWIIQIPIGTNIIKRADSIPVNPNSPVTSPNQTYK